jgi:H+/Cl- antiporter ClcA
MEYFEVNSMEDLIGLIIVAILFGLLGRYVNHKKGRSKYNGFWIGAFFGIIGVIVLALRPKAK